MENMCLNIKEFYSGGIQLPKFIFESFYNKTKRKIREGYGLTETAACAAYNYQEEGPVINSFGREFPGCKLKIMDKNENECAVDHIGEIYIKGDIVFKGYFNFEDATNSVLTNGWLRTGDFGKKDKDGYFYFCGLKKEMINMAGNKVYPKKLERLIKINENVLTANITSEASILQGYTVGAQIKLHNTSKQSQDELKKWCFNNINNNLLPKVWLFE
jgi:long-chain acyl-CoA synthetase